MARCCWGAMSFCLLIERVSMQDGVAVTGGRLPSCPASLSLPNNPAQPSREEPIPESGEKPPLNADELQDLSSLVSSCQKLPGQDSNLDKESQNLLCYRYTTGYFRG